MYGYCIFYTHAGEIGREPGVSIMRVTLAAILISHRGFSFHTLKMRIHIRLNWNIYIHMYIPYKYLFDFFYVYVNLIFADMKY